MRTIFGLFLLISSALTSVASARPELSFETVKERYQMICDPSGQAPFIQRPENKNGALCMMAVERAVTFIMNNPNPCDDTPNGRTVRSWLGPLCNSPKSIVVKDQYFSATKVCDDGAFSKALAAYVPTAKCILTYEESLPEGMHRCSDGKVRGPHLKKNGRAQAGGAEDDDV